MRFAPRLPPASELPPGLKAVEPGRSGALLAVTSVAAATLFILEVSGLVSPQLFVPFCFLSSAAILVTILIQSMTPKGYSWIEAVPWFVGMSTLYILVRPGIVVGLMGGDTTTVVGPFGVTTSLDAVIRATYIGLFGIVAFQLGYNSGWARRIGTRWAARQLPPPRSQFTLIVALGLLLVIGLAGRAAIITLKGGIANFQDLRGANNAGLGPVWYLAGLTITGAVIYIWAVCSGWCRRYRLLDAVILLSAPSILFINSRGGFLYFALAGLVCYRVFNPAARLVGRIVVIAAIVMAWGVVRGQLSPDATSADFALPSLETAEDIDEYTSKFLSLGVSDYYWNVVDNTPGVGEFQYGSILGRSIIDMTPRALWPNKPLAAGNYFMQAFFPEITSTILTPGMFGLLYLDGGAFGVVLGCFAYGLLMVALCTGAFRSRGPTIVSLVYALTFPNVPNVMQSGLQTIPTGWVWVAPPVIAIVLISRSLGVFSRGGRGPNAAFTRPGVTIESLQPGMGRYGRR